MKSRRQGAILELIESEPLHSQEQLRRRLLKAGFEATQATISRDIKELGLVKRSGDGAYQRLGVDAISPETALTALERAAAEFLRRVDRVQQLVVVRTGAGRQPLALAIDRARLAETVGTIAGDDTILVIARYAARGLRRRLSEYAGLTWNASSSPIRAGSAPPSPSPAERAHDAEVVAVTMDLGQSGS
jgi:transcriptional regulator of arginine metabolism